MKKLLFIIIIFSSGLRLFSQPTISLSTLLTYFEHGDTPTEAQFKIAWENSYNQVADGLWDFTGGPTISLAPYSSTGLNRFYTGSSLPTDTTYKLNYNGVFRVSKLVVNGSTIDFGSIDAFWTDAIDPTVVSLVDTSMDVSIGSGYSYGYKLYVKGESYFKEELHAVGVTVTNETGLEGFVTVDESGDMYLQDENSGPYKLSTLYSSGPWTATTNKIYNTSYTTDTVVIGSTIGGSGRFFNVKKSAYFSDSLYINGVFRTNANIYTSGGIYADAGLIRVPQVTLRYDGSNIGYINLAGKGNPGKMTFIDEDFPSGITLAELTASTGYMGLSSPNLYPSSTAYNLVLGGTNAYSFKLYVNGNSAFTGTAAFQNGISILSGARAYVGTNAYIAESGINMVFKDAANASTHTLTELLTGFSIEQDSLHIHKANMDSIYFDDEENKRIFCGGTNNLTIDLFGVDWLFEYEDNTYGVFNTDALMFNVQDDTLQDDVTFKQLGKIYVSKTDSVPYFYNGKAWFSLLDTANITYVVENTQFDRFKADSIFFGDSIYALGIEGPSWDTIYFKKLSKSYRTTLLNSASGFFLGHNSGSSIQGLSGQLNLYITDHSAQLINGYLILDSDTAATRAYARAYGGGGGGGTPGGSSGDLQYNNGGIFGGFWDYDGTDTITANNTSAIKFGTLNRLRSISTSMIIGAQGTSYYFTANDINTSITGGPSIRKAAGSTTTPVYSFYDDTDVGLSRSATNQMSLISNSAEIIRIKSDSVKFYKPLNVYNTDLIIERGYGAKFTNAGTNYWRITQEDANKLEFNYNGSQGFEFINGTPGYLTGTANSTGFGAFKNTVSTSTDPVYSFVDDLNTGIGRAGADQLSSISGGIEISRLYPDSARFYQDIKMNNKKMYFKANSLFDYNGNLQFAIGTTNYVMNQGYMISDPTSDDGFYIKTTGTSSTVPMYSFYVDQNTGIGWSRTDELSLIAGGSEEIQITTDSIVLKDSTYLDYISGSDATFVTLTPTRALDSATISGADFMIKYRDYKPAFIDYYLDIRNNERLWYMGYKNGQWITQYGLNLNNPNSLKGLQSKLELHDEYLYELYYQDNSLVIEIDTLKSENIEQREKINELEARLKHLEKMFNATIKAGLPE